MLPLVCNIVAVAVAFPPLLVMEEQLLALEDCLVDSFSSSDTLFSLPPLWPFVVVLLGKVVILLGTGVTVIFKSSSCCNDTVNADVSVLTYKDALILLCTALLSTVVFAMVFYAFWPFAELDEILQGNSNRWCYSCG